MERSVATEKSSISNYMGKNKTVWPFLFDAVFVSFYLSILSILIIIQVYMNL